MELYDKVTYNEVNFLGVVGKEMIQIAQDISLRRYASLSGML